MIEEGNVITLDNNARYLLVKEVIDPDTAKKYMLAVAITDEDYINYTEIAVFEATKDEDGEYVEKVNDKSQVYMNVVTAAYYDMLIEENPIVEDDILEQLEEIAGIKDEESGQ